MEKVTFVDPQTKESIDFFVVEETQVNGTRYFFVTEADVASDDVPLLISQNPRTDLMRLCDVLLI